MIIKGFQPSTLVDYPGHIAAIIFTAGCTFRCSYCYNKKLVDDDPELEEISQEDILKFLDKRKILLDGVVITGGEPTLHPDLPSFISKIKEKGFLVKLDTNGTNPEMLKRLIEEKMVDYIAMDIKNSPEKYFETVNVNVNIDNIKKAAELIMNSGIDYEFRTTAAPGFISKEDFIKIGSWLKGAKKYCLQQFKATGNLINPEYYKENTYSEMQLEEIKNILLPYFGKVEVRT